MQDDTHQQSLDGPMRIATLLLGFFGCAGALGAFSLLLLGLSDLKYIDSGREKFEAVSLVVLLLSGFWIWFGWLLYFFKQRFPLVSVRTFWLLSLIHHLIWLLLLIPADVWGGGDDPWWIPVWAAVNVVLATVFVFRYPRNKKLAEQGDGDQTPPAVVG